MKKIILCLVVVLLNGCAVQNLVLDTYYSEILIEKTDLYYPEDFNVNEINGIYDIVDWIQDRVNYDYDSDFKYIWRSSEKILSDKVGNCKDYSLLFMNLYYIKYSEKTSIAFYHTSRKIINGGEVNHSIVIVDNTLIEPQTGNIVNDTIGYSYSFDEIFN
jgi:hypothetical protein